MEQGKQEDVGGMYLHKIFSVVLGLFRTILARFFILIQINTIVFIHAVSPVKKASPSGKNYFNCTLQSEKTSVRAVCFKP